MLTPDEVHHINRVLDPTPVWHRDCARLKAIITRLDDDNEKMRAVVLAAERRVETDRRGGYTVDAELSDAVTALRTGGSR